MELARRLGRNLALQDLCCLAYHGYMLLRACLAADYPTARNGIPLLSGLLLVTALTVVVVRGELLPAGRTRALLYRCGLVVPVALCYLPLRHALPALGNRLLDPELWRLDIWLFGDTPAQMLERFVTP